MREETLETLSPLLNVLRGYSVLEEVRTAAFHLEGRDFIHFHDDEPEGLVADVRLAKGRLRMPVSTRSEQAELLEKIEQKLSSLEARAEKPGRGRKRRRGHVSYSQRSRNLKP